MSLMDHDYSSKDLPLEPSCSHTCNLCWVCAGLSPGSFIFVRIFLKSTNFFVLYCIDNCCVGGRGENERRSSHSVGDKHAPAFSAANCERFVVSPPGWANPLHHLLPCFSLPQELTEIKRLDGTPCQIKLLLSFCITFLCLSPGLLEVFSPVLPPTPSPTLPSLFVCLTTDCFFSSSTNPLLQHKLVLVDCYR